MPLWEFKTVPLSSEVSVRRQRAARGVQPPASDTIILVLNEHGKEGWELVSIWNDGDAERPAYVAIMKRELVQS